MNIGVGEGLIALAGAIPAAVFIKTIFSKNSFVKKDVFSVHMDNVYKRLSNIETKIDKLISGSRQC